MAIITRIIGLPGSGKTTVLNALADSLEDNGIAFVHTCGGSTISGITQLLKMNRANTLLIDGCSEASLSVLESWEGENGLLYVYAAVSEHGRGESAIAAPSHWSGDGLPPVGVVCEVNHVDGWIPCTVGMLHRNGDGSTDAIYSYERGDGPEWDFSDNPKHFRPIRTPEQIATEEREKAIEEIQGTVFLACGTVLAQDVVEALVKAGYRKPEGGAQ